MEEKFSHLQKGPGGFRGKKKKRDRKKKVSTSRRKKGGVGSKCAAPSPGE